jgi:hypothetical protein
MGQLRLVEVNGFELELSPEVTPYDTTMKALWNDSNITVHFRSVSYFS